MHLSATSAEAGKTGVRPTCMC